MDSNEIYEHLCGWKLFDGLDACNGSNGLSWRSTPKKRGDDLLHKELGSFYENPGPPEGTGIFVQAV